MPNAVPTTYVCCGCLRETTFRLAMIPYRRWLLTCRKCNRYHLHRLVLRDPLPRLIR